MLSRSTGRAILALLVALGSLVGAATAQVEFEPVRALPFPFSPAYFVAPADWDGDGDIDVIGASSGVAVALNDGGGGFTPGAGRAFGWLASAMAVADFDGDGTLDVALHRHEAVVTVVLGDGSGGFGAEISTPVFDLRFGADPMLAGDFDSDGASDLLVFVSSRLYLIRFDGAGALVARLVYQDPAAWDVTAGDWNEDGHLDFVTSLIIDRGFHLVLGDGAGGFAAPRRVFSPFGCPGPVATSDVNDDGHLDIISALLPLHCDLGSTEVELMLGDGTGGFPDFSRFNENLAYYTNPIVHVDLDGDGRRDLATAGLIVCPGRGGGEFDGRSVLVPDIGLAFGEPWIDTADFDGDGLADVLGCEGVHLNRSPSVAQAAARRGNVDARVAGPADVLFVNGSPGAGHARKAVVAWDESLDLSLTGPPSNPLGPARFALYAWLAIPVGEDPVALPFGIGVSSLPMPPSGGSLVPRPKQVWNNLGHTAWLGVPTQPSSPAPTAVVSKPRGLRVVTDFFVQGIIRDTAAPNGRAAVTNGVFVTVR